MNCSTWRPLCSFFLQGQNSVFGLRLDDVSGVFDVEPKQVTGSSPVSIRIANGTLDYENPNQRKFIVLVSLQIFATFIFAFFANRKKLMRFSFEDNCRGNGDSAKAVVNSNADSDGDRCKWQSSDVWAWIVFVFGEWNRTSKSFDWYYHGQRFGFGPIWYDGNSIFIIGCGRRPVSCE